MKNEGSTSSITVFFLTLIITTAVALTTLPRGLTLYWSDPGFAEYVFSCTIVFLIFTAIAGFIIKNHKN